MRSKKLQSIVTTSGYNFDCNNLCHWWFGKCPPKELFSCWHYEYLRDCPSIVERVLEWRKANPGWRDPVRYIDADPGERLAYLFEGWPYERIIWDWPEKPYLEIDPKIQKLHLTIKGIQGEFLYHCLEVDRDKMKPVALFRVYDWTLPKTTLAKQFKQFLKNERPEGITIREPRGHRKMRTFVGLDLNALGAYRLSRIMNQNRVISHMQTLLDRAPYKNQPAVSKAVKRVKEALAWFESRL